MGAAGALADEMRFEGYNWCEICPLFARHYDLFAERDFEGESTALNSCEDGVDNNGDGTTDLGDADLITDDADLSSSDDCSGDPLHPCPPPL